MLCQRCQQREAKVQLSKIENGQTHELYLCEICAKQTHEVSFIVHPAIVPEFLQALFGFNPSSIEQPSEMACPKCGITFSQITQAGKLGCSACYETFEAQLEPLLRRVHGGGQNVGKVPVRRGIAIKCRMEEKKLKEKLQVLIQQEAFEEAAVVRDQIRQIEQSKGGEKHDT
ncbi:UvrB/UvrC motif-containing protein [Desulfosporosinus sp. OT]|uniref:UvrB/UvrC motif-containing protein n=1 Tax=Desulfosporosinus sp. OT TaxID=913865 RepID=UPI000223A7BC|nr:UvrB/UvrC motif-containing protein [Desulfosporosinus sp. OT]EGW37738.1 uvrB/uvrC motif family protein [Desulfosporosinus sp. OT]